MSQINTIAAVTAHLVLRATWSASQEVSLDAAGQAQAAIDGCRAAAELITERAGCSELVELVISRAADIVRGVAEQDSSALAIIEAIIEAVNAA